MLDKVSDFFYVKGDLDKIDLSVDIMSRRDDKTAIYGKDIAFLYEAAKIRSQYAWLEARYVRTISSDGTTIYEKKYIDHSEIQDYDKEVLCADLLTDGVNTAANLVKALDCEISAGSTFVMSVFDNSNDTTAENQGMTFIPRQNWNMLADGTFYPLYYDAVSKLFAQVSDRTLLENSTNQWSYDSCRSVAYTAEKVKNSDGTTEIKRGYVKDFYGVTDLKVFYCDAAFGTENAQEAAPAFYAHCKRDSKDSPYQLARFLVGYADDFILYKVKTRHLKRLHGFLTAQVSGSASSENSLGITSKTRYVTIPFEAVQDATDPTIFMIRAQDVGLASESGVVSVINKAGFTLPTAAASQEEWYHCPIKVLYLTLVGVWNL